MQSNLEGLKITEKELEYLSGIDVNDMLMGDVYGPSILSDPNKLTSFCLNQLFMFGLIFIFVFPIGLIILRNFSNLSGDTRSTLQLLQIAVVTSLIIILVWNLYLWIKSKSMSFLAGLLDEVNKYNELVKAVEIIDKLEAVRNLGVSLVNREEVIEALRVTRESLLCALMTERILRDNKRFVARRYELFNTIENNLTTVMALKINNQANEYGQLLNEVLQVGIDVHKAMQQLQD